MDEEFDALARLRKPWDKLSRISNQMLAICQWNIFFCEPFSQPISPREYSNTLAIAQPVTCFGLYYPRVVFQPLLNNDGSRYPKLVDLDASSALIFLGVFKMEEFRCAMDMI